MAGRKHALLVPEAGDDPRLVEGNPSEAFHERRAGTRQTHRSVPVFDQVPVRVKAQLRARVMDVVPGQLCSIHLGVIDEVLHNLSFVKPATVPVMQPLR